MLVFCTLVCCSGFLMHLSPLPQVGEPSFVRLLKLQVLSLIVTPDTVGTILREFQTYVQDGDEAFVRAAIQSVGLIATKLPSVADRCLRGLMGLINIGSNFVVASAIIVIRQLLQQHPQHVNIIVRLAKRLSSTTVPPARAAIVWIIGEFQSQDRVARLAPDTLRVLAKGFREEHSVVKNQILNLAVRSLHRGWPGASNRVPPISPFFDIHVPCYACVVRCALCRPRSTSASPTPPW